MKERSELLEEANTLGLEFPSNIPTIKLEEMIADAQGPAVKLDDEISNNDSDVNSVKSKNNEVANRKAAYEEKNPSLRQRIKDAKNRAMKKVIVTVTNKDNRENDIMTTAQVSFENQHFGMSRDIPLDIPVEIEQALVDILEGTMMTLHKDEIINGKRTGNKTPVSVKKFAISYGKAPE